MRRLVAAAVVAALLSLGASAGANGRFPQSNHVFFSPQNPDLVLLRVTFGLIVSHDRGKTWDWICEKSIGTSGVEDPMYAIGPTGTILGTTFAGLAISRDDACSFAFAPSLAGQVFIDLSARPDPRSVVVFSSSYDEQDDAGNILFSSLLYETNDEGQTFARLGSAIDPAVLGETVDVAPTDADRLYVSGVKNPGSAPEGTFLVSRDRGKTWAQTAVPFVSGERSIFIAAVDPKNADRVYVRTLAATDQPARLLVTDDAGKTFRTVFTGKGSLPGFALAPDGARVWVGGALDGVRVARTTDFGFEQRSSTPVECLAVAADGLWACASEKDGFVAGLSSDDGATFTAKLHFCDIRGPRGCAATSTTTQACTPLWPAQRATLGCNKLPEAGPDAGDDEGDGNVSAGGGCTLGAPWFASATPVAAAIAGFAALVMAARHRRRRDAE